MTTGARAAAIDARSPELSPMSRPRKQRTEQRLARLNARVTPAELAQVEGQASAAGISASEFVRRAALGLRITPRRTQVENAAVVELIRVGNNLNQMARATNSGRSPMAAELRHALGELQTVLRRLTHRSESAAEPACGQIDAAGANGGPPELSGGARDGS
jgi:hypothetical protein